MPELPELQAHAERLDSAFSGAVLEQFRALNFTALKTASPDPSDALGAAVVFIGRRGKYLVIDLGHVSFVIHLMQAGRLVVDESRSARPRGGLARWVFDEDRALLLTEAGKERRAGIWVVDGDFEQQEPLTGLGPDADLVSLSDLADLAGAQSRRLHGFLRDQQVMAGLGRRLANEICHRARLSPFINTTKLDRVQLEQLHEAIRACINESLAEERGRDHMAPSKQRRSAVHRRAGETCPVCGDVIRAVSYKTHEVNYCPACQTGGRVLADNTTSRFLR